MPIHLRELPKGQRFVLTRTGDKFTYLGVGVSPYSGSYQHLCQREYGDRKVTSLHHRARAKFGLWIQFKPGAIRIAICSFRLLSASI